MPMRQPTGSNKTYLMAVTKKAVALPLREFSRLFAFLWMTSGCRCSMQTKSMPMRQRTGSDKTYLMAVTKKAVALPLREFSRLVAFL